MSFVTKLAGALAVIAFGWVACGGGSRSDDDDGSAASSTGAGASGTGGSAASALCPASCVTDAECMACGTARVCSAGRCAACSPNAACPGGFACAHGACVPACGASGDATCSSDPDCAACGYDAEVWNCSPGLGACAPPSASCNDVAGTTILPAPFASATSICSNDSECAGRSASLEVGSLIRQLIGASEVVVNGTGVPIADATIDIGVTTCGEVALSSEISCGFCAPCDSHDDCGPYLLAPLKDALFAGDPSTELAYAALVEQMYGSASVAQLHFFCQPVTTGMGTCSPCSNLTQSCTDL